VIFAAGIEGGGAVTYRVVQGSNASFVQGPTPHLGRAAPAATLERNGKLALAQP
jgi:hypothetical protein